MRFAEPSGSVYCCRPYTVTLVATNSYGTDSEIKTNYINVAPYCIPSYTNGAGAGDYISLVQLGSINNATGASTGPYYTYFSSLSTDIARASSNTITLSAGTYYAYNNISVWIDYNNNGVFETSEKLGNVEIAGCSGNRYHHIYGSYICYTGCNPNAGA
ncbi:MAG: hypothetical protein IPH20_12390 [Bacteroidales bacterium]|nr:hypothetical protein [Bacteroidales bacterium]